MEIKSPSHRLSLKRMPPLLLGCFLLGLLVAVATDLPTQVKRLRKETARLLDVTAEEGKRATLGRLTAAALAKPKRIVIDLKHKHLERLRFKRQEALRYGFLITTPDSYVPAKVTVDGRMHRVKLRLKGDLVDHLFGKKWSFRIEARGADAIEGMRRFSVQSPERSNFMQEWLLHQWLAKEGLIALRYDFVQVVLNGDSLGIFAREESFAKELIEHNCRREGPILKFDERHLMDPRSVSLGDYRTHEDLYFAADIISFQTGKVFRRPELRNQLRVGVHLLDGVRRGLLPASEAFDIDRAARLYALFDILRGGHHGLRWKNVRFYFNPILNKLELIAYNAYGLHRRRGPITNIFYQDYCAGDVGIDNVFAWHQIFFSDPLFVERYFRHLRRLTAPGTMEAFFDAIRPQMERQLALIGREYPLYRFPMEFYRSNRRRIQAILNPKLPIRAVYRSGGQTGSVTIVNPTYLPLVIDGLTFRGQRYNRPTGFLPGKQPKTPLDETIVHFPGLPSDFGESDSVRLGDHLVLQDASLSYHFLGEEGTRTVPVDALAMDDPAAFAASAVVASQRLRRLASQQVLRYDQGRNIVTFLPGRHHIRSDIVIPKGCQVSAEPGTELSLEDGASLVSYAPLRFIGTKTRPIIIDSDDRTGEGVTVLQAGGPSSFAHLIFRNQAAPAKGLWHLTGAMTLYESDVTLKHCLLADSRSEDLLNVVRGDLAIDDVTLQRSRSDAIDTDFATITIRNSRFIDCGNDCIDVSGSKGRIRKISIDHAGDKGISIGEKSKLLVSGSSIRHASTGIGVKDLSQGDLRGLEIADCRIGVAAYRKKPEFGGAAVKAQHVLMKAVAKSYSADGESTITVDGKTIPPQESDR